MLNNNNNSNSNYNENIKSKSKNKADIKKVIKNVIKNGLSILSLPFTYLYMKIGSNKKYYINEKNLKIPIFVYHNIVENNNEIIHDYMQTTIKTFKSQMQGLKKFGYHYISYDDLIDYKNGKKKLYKNSALVTFDDGYNNIYKKVFPFIQKENIPIASYIIIDNMEDENVLTWENTKLLDNSPLVTIASHSMDHADFSILDTNDAIKNIEKSYEIIEKHLGKKDTKIFTYPGGMYKEETISALAEKGYIQNLTDNKINKSNALNLNALSRCYPLNDITPLIILKIIYRSIRYK